MEQAKILVVEDSPTTRAMVEDQLEECGYVVLPAENGVKALAAVDHFCPDLIVTDVSMPEMDGFELCMKLKNDPAHQHVPIIMLTAATDDDEVIKGLGLGVSDYIRKPFNADELVLRIRNILQGQREQSRLKDIFCRHTSPEVMEELMARPEEYLAAGEERKITVLFADIRGFTTMVSGADPRAIVTELNEVLTIMSESVIGEGGTLDKFLGDGIMALFGAPLKHVDDSERAVRAAFEIQHYIARQNREREEKGARQMWVGIGVASGPALVGTIGSPRRMDYTAIGDCVNVASRLQGLAKPGEIIVSEQVYATVADSIKGTLLENVRVKGKSEPIEAYLIVT